MHAISTMPECYFTSNRNMVVSITAKCVKSYDVKISKNNDVEETTLDDDNSEIVNNNNDDDDDLVALLPAT